MKKTFCAVTTLIFIFPSIVLSEEKLEKEIKKTWENSFITGFTISQVSYNNWVKGGENALSWTASVDMKFHKDDEKSNWNTVGKFRFGQSKQEELGIRKTVDKIDLSSVYTHKYKKALNPFFSAAILTQFAKGYNYKVSPRIAKSDFGDPVYLEQSSGACFLINSYFQTRTGIAVREIISNNYAKWGYTDNIDTLEFEKYKIETGMTSVTTFYKKIGKNLLIDSKLELFSRLDGIRNVDIKFENIITAQVAKYIGVKFELLIYYDRNVSKTTQIRQTLGIGFSYNLF